MKCRASSPRGLACFAWCSALCLAAAASRGAAQDEEDALSEPAASEETEASPNDAADESAMAGDGAVQAPDGASTSETSALPVLPTAALEVGIGMTQREIAFSAFDGKRSLDTGFVPALHLALGAKFGERWFLGFGGSYQSSVLAKYEQSAPDPSSHPALTTTIQSHRLSLGLQPGVRFGASREGSSLALFLGYGLRALGSVVEMRVPRYTIHGPLVALELEWALVPSRLVLHVAPEFQLLDMQAVREVARTQGVGFVIGGSASLRVYVTEWMAVALSYREAHARAASAWPSPFTDVERFAIINAHVRYY